MLSLTIRAESSDVNGYSVFIRTLYSCDLQPVSTVGEVPWTSQSSEAE